MVMSILNFVYSSTHFTIEVRLAERTLTRLTADVIIWKTKGVILTWT